MGRFARLVIPGCPHHLTQRGNHRQPVFFSDSERDLYLELKKKYFELAQIQLDGYSLMTNHTHDLVIPATPTSLAKGFGRLHNDYARWQQIQHNQTGHLWQNRFWSCPMDEDHFWKTLRYIELNPVRAGLVRHAWEWPWSSARAHVKGVDDTGMLNMDRWSTRFDGERWREFLREPLDEDEQNRIRLSTRTGRPLGSEQFLRELEVLTGRSLRARKRGPKPTRRAQSLVIE